MIRQSYLSGARGEIRHTLGITPAAGLKYLSDLSTLTMSRLLYLQVAIVTNATAANRLIMLGLRDGAQFRCYNPLGIVITASQTLIATWAIGHEYRDMVATHSLYTNPLMADMWFTPPQQIEIGVTNFQATDTLAGIEFITEELYL